MINKFTFLNFVLCLAFCYKICGAESSESEYEILVPSPLPATSFAEICKTGHPIKISEWLTSVAFHKNKKLINTANKEGLTPLMYAVQYNLPDAVHSFLESGANLNKKAGENEFTALHYAILGGKTDLVEALLKANANVNVKSKDNSDSLSLTCQLQNLTMLDVLLNQPSLSQKRVEEELSIAIDKQRDPIKEKLLGSNVAISDECFTTAISNNNLAILTAALQAGIMVTTNHIHQALLGANVETIRMLVNYTDFGDSGWEPYVSMVNELVSLDEQRLKERFAFMQKHTTSLLYTNGFEIKDTLRDDYYKNIYCSCIEWPKENNKLINNVSFSAWIADILTTAIRRNESDTVYLIRSLEVIDVEEFISNLDTPLKIILSDNPKLLVILLSERLPPNTRFRQTKSSSN